MLQATAREKRSRVGRVSVSLRLVQRTEEVPVPAAGASRPAWAGLYAIVCLAILMLFSVDFVFPTAGPARTAADVLVVLLGFALVWTWLRGHRAALARSPRPAHRA